MLRKRTLLHLEYLEDRCVPTVTAKLVSGSLFLAGTPAGELDVTHTTGSLFQVTDNGNAVGVPVNLLGNLSISLKHTTGDLKIDLKSTAGNQGKIPGNV